MWGEVLLLCLSGSLYPVALAAVIAYLGGPTPLRDAIAFMAGGAIACAITGIGIAVAVKQFGLTTVKHPTPSALVDIVLGAGVLAFAATLLLRFRRTSAAEPPRAAVQPDTAQRQPSVGKAVTAGVIIYAPMLSYFASVKIIASHTSGVALLAAGIGLCIVVTLIVVEVPILLILVAGERAQPVLRRLSALMARYAKPTVLALGALAGCYLIAKGLFAL